MDAIAVSMAAPGRYAGVTASGTALTAEQTALLARAVDLREHGLRIAFDPDSAGRDAAIKAYARLSQVTDDITAVTLPDGVDPAKLLEQQGRQHLRDALTSNVRPLAELVVDARIQAWEHEGELENIETQFAAIRAAGKTIANLPPREAATQANRIAALFITLYHWNPGEATGELIEALEREMPARRSESAPGCRDPTAGLPSRTTSVVANGTAPHAGRTTTSTRVFPPSSVAADRRRAQPQRLNDGRG